ncbi:PREDICTED: neuronal calcium sensor 2-like isoform X2 [Priapulus caudatus]|uniref:Neuronal calcium sensor 2-like isoform X2 n=1 Tax=Priapulus caudatus TaxID=37621 RepID=A0ABM1F220_PRICU|nr:PREDICTED: neuronal calcium sensor 2-like isoform X2 [Priapulus caudatus]
MDALKNLNSTASMGKAFSKQHKLTDDELVFLKNNTSFTEEQIREWHRGFHQDCPSGQLSRKKFIEVYKQFFPTGKAETFCDHVFRTFDQDNSGYIDFKEFLLAINVTSSGTPEQKLNWAFKMYDIDNSGTIELSEMTKIIQAIYEMLGADANQMQDTPEDRAKRIFQKMDENKDGALTQDEFIHGCKSDEDLYKILTGS